MNIIRSIKNISPKNRIKPIIKKAVFNILPKLVTLIFD